jgi:hypothetical protein
MERTMPIYHQPVRLLMHEMVTSLPVRPGETFSRSAAVEWFAKHYPAIKPGTVGAHLIQLTTNARSRVHHNPKPGEDDLFYQVDNSHFRLYDPSADPAPIRVAPPAPVTDNRGTSEEVEEGSEFAQEHDLRDYLALNPGCIEPGLRLYEDTDGITGVEFPVGGRFIDILAVDPSGGYVVIELKRSRAYDRTVGQLLRYIGWIRRYHAEPGQRVRGMIVARQITEDLLLACAGLPDVDLLEYSLSVRVRRVTGAPGNAADAAAG